MPINSGTAPITSIRLGSTEITRVYQGTTIVYDLAAATVHAAVRSTSTATVAYNTTSKTIAAPAGIVAGDLLLIYMTVDYGTLAGTGVPTGFTTLHTHDVGDNSDKQVIGYKVAGSSEPASYTMTVPTDADLRADMICIQDADTNTVPAVASVLSSASTTAHTAPTVTPKTGKGVLVCAASKSASAGGMTFSWTPPTDMTERTDATTNGYVTLTTATQDWDSTSATGPRTFGLTTSSAATAAIMSSVVVASGPLSDPPPEPEPAPGYAAEPSNGSGGSYTDTTATTSRTFAPVIDGQTVSSVYRFYGSHVARDRAVPLHIHLHGDGAYEYDNPDTWTSPLYRQAAIDNGGLFIIPKAMDVEYGYLSWWSGTRGADWVNLLIQDLYGKFNIDKRRIMISGFSGGAVITTEDLLVRHHSTFLGGGAMMLGGGQAGTLVGTHSAQLKQDFLMRWHVGELDDGRNTEDGYNARLYAENGEAWFRGQGFNTAITYIPGEDHGQSEDNGPAAMRALINLSNTHYGLPTI